MRKEQKSGKAEQKIVKHLKRLGNRVHLMKKKQKKKKMMKMMMMTSYRN